MSTSTESTLPASVLLVDDETSFVEAMAERLALRNFKAIVANTGDEALAQLEKNPELDVVVLDLRMPGMGGIETLNEIKKKHPLMSVVILTGHATVKTSVEAMKTGAFEYLEKPYDIEQLVATITAALARKRKFEDRIFDARIKPYCTGGERKKIIKGLIDEAAGNGRGSGEDDEK